MTSATSPVESQSAGMLSRLKVWFWGPIAPLVALDLWSKAAAFGFMESNYPGRTLVREHFIWEWEPLSLRFVTWHNTGTIWGLGREYNGALIAVRLVAVALITYFAWKLPLSARLRQLALGMILAGAIGNLYDNLTEEKGGVRDFLFFTGEWFGGWQFPAFNVADSCITVGAITLACLLWLGVEESPDFGAEHAEE